MRFRCKDSLTVRKENIALNLIEKQKSEEVLKSRPITIVLPTGSKCNLRCIFCTDRSHSTPYHYRNLSFKEFLKCAEPLEKAKCVGLYGWGEPLVNNNYREIFDYVAEFYYGIEIYITTNGVLLSQEWARRFVEYDWTRVTISINAATDSTYQEIMKADVFQRVISNVRNITRLRRAAKRQSPIVTLSFVSLSQNIRELPAFVDLSADLGCDYVLVQDLRILEKGQESYSLFTAPELAAQCYKEARKRARERNITLSTLQPMSYWENNAPLDCFEPWESFRIGENGDVYTCCYSNHPMGNVLKNKVEEVWNGKSYRYYRRKVNTDNPPLECRKCANKATSGQLVNRRWR